MMPEDFSKLSSENLSKLSSAQTITDNYSKISTESNWSQTYPPHPGQGVYHSTTTNTACPPTTTDYHHQMQQTYANNTLSKYWS